MSTSKHDFSIKYFRPSQRTVFSHNGFLNTRTKRTIAKDRLVVAEQRALEIERQKSISNLQLLAFEQKQLEKRLLSLQNLSHSPRVHKRSISEVNIHMMDRITSLNDALELNQSKSYTNLNNKNKNILFLPTINSLTRTVFTCCDGVLSANQVLTSDTESTEEEEEEGEEEDEDEVEEDEGDSKFKNKKTIQPPEIAVIPPE
ncbi:unnamed protein product [Rotaria magnacalcarata]|uniref:Uncharacterized protein n=2 Tax=Rotaria magnacalcarata TaxID=392030 RepID=A0A816AT83_9BILA|nr:unnamed protein product [Rotaria magnacalcarata]CAF1601077.1 unnamed protein product [Rotaria magnacalcarata]CAF2191001.1 unnamed protein product [Rotaria magnacalcarata]CAF3764495.1 unnamed protein product [Rotaria magnacalcarata]CAF4150928.1 unnamed protein product [Rotaria magnacalcarata]